LKKNNFKENTSKFNVLRKLKEYRNKFIHYFLKSLSMNECYKIGDQKYNLVHKEYDDPLFKTNVYELLETDENNCEKILSETELETKFKEINFCTFRGEHNFSMIELLQKNNFQYVDNFFVVQTNKNEFKPIKNKISVKIEVILGEPSENQKKEILKIQKNVYDHSTFQTDLRINPDISSERSCLRVKSFFNNIDHLIFLARDTKNKEKIVGFLQFILSKPDVECENGAVISDSQGFLYGPVLYSYAFNYIFEKYVDVDTIFAGCGLTNNKVLRLFQKLNFKIVHKEVHFRKIDLNNDVVSSKNQYSCRCGN